MLDESAIEKIAEHIYRKYFGDKVIKTVQAHEFVDSSGDDAVRIEITIMPGTSNQLKGEQLAKAALDLQRSLTAEGEERFAHASFGEFGEVFEAESPVNEEADFESEDEEEDDDGRS